jgi:hypothetical protein
MSDFVVVFCVIGFFLALGAVAWLVNANYGVGRENDKLAAQRRYLHGAVAEAREAFARYEAMHAMKMTPEADKKAQVNRDLKNRMHRALRYTDYQELGPLQQVFDHLRKERERNEFHG